MKSLFVIAAVILFSFSVPGNAWYNMHDHSEFGIEENDIRKIHDFNWMTECDEKTVNLTEDQVNELKKYGLELSAEDRKISYIRVIRKRSGGRFGGNVFVVRGKGEFGNYELLACVHADRIINEIYVRTNPMDSNGSSILGPEFLDQFVGRSLDKSFDFREKPEDYFYVPVKLAAIMNAPATSRDIASKLKKLVAISQVALK